MANHSAKDFLVCAAIGSVLGGVTALLIAPKSGEELREDLSGLYDRTGSFVDQMSKKGKSIANSLNKKGDWTDKANALLCELSSIECQEGEGCTRDILIGTAVGGLIGTVAGLLFTSKTGVKLRQDLFDTYEQFTNSAEELTSDVRKKGKAFVNKASKGSDKWLNVARSLAGQYIDGAADEGEDILEGAKDKVENIIEWANLGYKVWQGLNKRR